MGNVWRPPNSITARNTRAIRSMQNGSMDGRIVSAYPARLDDDDYEVDDDIDDGSTAGDGVQDVSVDLLPWTDYRTVTNVTNISFTLTYSPWKQLLMAPGTENRATVHFYWNGVFQRDMAYTLDGFGVTITNPNKAIREGDVITVKYWYDGSNPGGPFGDPDPDPNEVRFNLETWISSIDHVTDGFGWFIFACGPTSAPPIGSHGGFISTVAHRYVTSQFLKGWTNKFRLQTGDLIPVADAADIKFYLNYDDGASMGFTYNGLSTQGANIGTTYWRKACCGFCPDDGGDPTAGILQSIPSITPEPKTGPSGGIVLADSSTNSFGLANYLNGTIDGFGTHRDIGVDFSMPSVVATWNSGCGTQDDTIYGKHTYESATYDATIGVTCVVTYK